MKHNAQTLINLLDEFGAKPSPGMGRKLLVSYPSNCCSNLYPLHTGTEVKKDKGKPIICSVLCAVVLAAV